MDPAHFLDQVTSGHLFGWKTAVATFVIALASFQVALAARFWGVGGIRIDPATAGRIHRWNGRAVLVLTLLVGFACLLGPAGPVSPARVLVHSILGALLFLLFAAKLLAVRSSAGADVGASSGSLPALGLALFAVYVLSWITSVADFVIDSTTDPGPSAMLKVWVAGTALIAVVLGLIGVGGFVLSAVGSRRSSTDRTGEAAA